MADITQLLTLNVIFIKLYFIFGIVPLRHPTHVRQSIQLETNNTHIHIIHAY